MSVATTSPAFDAREAGRIVASVLAAAGPAPADLVERASDGLARLALPRLVERDFVVSSPEELAPRLPPPLREAVAALLLDVAGEEPLRVRVARAYAGAWGVRPVATVSPPRDACPRRLEEKVLRRVVGTLPRHQVGAAVPHGAEASSCVKKEENVSGSIYRVEEGGWSAAPAEDPLRARVARVQREMLHVVAVVSRVVIGKEDAVSRVVTTMAARGHVLLVDTPGVGKTLLCKTIAAALGLRFGRVQLTPDLMPMDVTGATIYDERSKQFVFRPGPVFTNVVLADEINRATPKTQSALLEVMEERTVTEGGVTHRMPDPFQVLATMNPLDHDGTFPLPAAQIDRFMIMLELGLPAPEDEVRVLDTHLGGALAVEATAPVLDVQAFVEWQRTVPLVHASPEIKRAAVAYVDGLRRTAPSANTLSPRATLAWVRAAQARAILGGREFVVVEDLLDVAPDVLRHRLWMSAPEVRDRLRAMTSHVVRVAGVGP